VPSTRSSKPISHATPASAIAVERVKRDVDVASIERRERFARLNVAQSDVDAGRLGSQSASTGVSATAAMPVRRTDRESARRTHRIEWVGAAENNAGLLAYA
jgi:hypothetical protein